MVDNSVSLLVLNAILNKICLRKEILVLNVGETKKTKPIETKKKVKSMLKKSFILGSPKLFIDNFWGFITFLLNTKGTNNKL